ncbi:hypothetical protein CSC3H3_18445 [Thalassospira marina]|uniref:Uncharacterized protein n=1 Tax=Thalassospira marina TaxID=2048283 RepID=A0ABM6QD94_9PROT|nr:hypothetical protein CSC3H3_18445 [Thalassospira marina]
MQPKAAEIFDPKSGLASQKAWHAMMFCGAKPQFPQRILPFHDRRDTHRKKVTDRVPHPSFLSQFVPFVFCAGGARALSGPLTR